MDGASAPVIYSIGHSTHSGDRLVALLRAQGIEVLVDVRSQPYSRFAPQFNRETLRDALSRDGLKYLFLGRELGGRPEGDEFYDAEGHVLYGKLADAELFRAGIARVLDGAKRFRIALMCSEEDPTGCHRRLLVGRVLADRGAVVCHIRGDGRIENEEAATSKAAQVSLFEATLEEPWRSIRSVSRRRQPAASSAH